MRPAPPRLVLACVRACLVWNCCTVLVNDHDRHSRSRCKATPSDTLRSKSHTWNCTLQHFRLHLISSPWALPYFILHTSSHFISSELFSPRLTSSHLISSHLISPHTSLSFFSNYFHLIWALLNLSHLIEAFLTPPNPHPHPPHRVAALSALQPVYHKKTQCFALWHSQHRSYATITQPLRCDEHRQVAKPHVSAQDVNNHIASYSII